MSQPVPTIPPPAPARPEPGPPHAADAPTVVPEGFRHTVVETRETIPHGRGEVWRWLCDPATFVDGQIWPFEVEFVGGGFEPGVLTNHRGPFLSLPALIGEMRDGAYRDLRYLYGAYVGSARLARPTRLQLWLDDADAPGHTTLRVRVDAHVRPWFAGAWRRGNLAFWRRFAGWAATASGSATARRAGGRGGR